MGETPALRLCFLTFIPCSFSSISMMSLHLSLNPQSEAVDLARGIADSITADSPADVAIFVPFPFLETVHSIVGNKLIVGAEMVTPEMKGAFTGGVSPCMLKSMGIKLKFLYYMVMPKDGTALEQKDI